MSELSDRLRKEARHKSVELPDTTAEETIEWRAATVLDQQEVRLKQYESAFVELRRYFTSGNCIPIERAVIKAVDFWRIVDEVDDADEIRQEILNDSQK